MALLLVYLVLFENEITAVGLGTLISTVISTDAVPTTSVSFPIVFHPGQPHQTTSDSSLVFYSSFTHYPSAFNYAVCTILKCVLIKLAHLLDFV